MAVSRITSMLVSVALAVAVGCGSKTNPSGPSTHDDKGGKGAGVQKPAPGSVEAVFDGFPPELAANLRTDGAGAQRAKANAWLAANVNGKSKPVKITVPADATTPQPGAKNGPFVAKLELYGKRDSLLGDSWVVVVHDGRFRKREGVFGTEAFEFVDLSEADAKWLSELTSVTIEGQVDEAAIIPDEKDGSIISLKIKAAKVNGKSFRAEVPKK